MYSVHFKQAELKDINFAETYVCEDNITVNAWWDERKNNNKDYVNYI